MILLYMITNPNIHSIKKFDSKARHSVILYICMVNADIIATLCSGYLSRQVILRLAVIVKINEYIPRSKRITNYYIYKWESYRDIGITLYGLAEIWIDYDAYNQHDYIGYPKMIEYKTIEYSVNYCFGCKKFHQDYEYNRCDFDTYTYICAGDGIKCPEYKGIEIYDAEFN